MKFLNYHDPATVLRGQIITEYYAGRPNYGESPELDELEHSIVLLLDEPFSIAARDPEREGDYESAGCENVEAVQLAGSIDIEHLRKIRGHGVELIGPLFAAHTGHHHTAALMSVDDRQTAIIDERNTFPEAHVIGGGTGFLLGYDGLIITAAHVVAGAHGITITRGLLRARVTPVCSDKATDLAILKLESDNPVAKIMENREALVRPVRTWMPPRLGERVYAFGFPLRSVLPHTLNMSEGIVSAEIAPLSERFQISCPIQKGNSGGPLYDQHANLIGVVTSKLPPIRGAERENDVLPEDINFAVRTDPLLDLCRTYSDRSVLQDESRVSNPPIVLGKLMQRLCVEVECWQRGVAQTGSAT